MKRIVIVVVIIIVCSIGAEAIWSKRNNIHSGSKTLLERNVSHKENERTPDEWNTYLNQKYSFSFQYPKEWIRDEKETEVVNLSGTITTVEVYFRDTATKSVFLIVYNLAPHGNDIFKYIQTQYRLSKGWYANKAGFERTVARRTAIQANDTLLRNGKGQVVNTPIKSIIVDFLDDQQTGEFQLQFKTPLTSAELECQKFEQLLTTFQIRTK